MADTVRVSRRLPAGLLAFGIAAFALPGEAAYSLVFYVCVVPAVALGWRARPGWGAGDGFALALIAWSGLTLLWGEGSLHRAFQFGVGVAASAVFFVASRRVLACAKMRRRFAAFLIFSGTANAGLVLLLRAPALLAGERIFGWGVTRQPILGGSVMAVCCLTALASALGDRLIFEQTCPNPDPPHTGEGEGKRSWIDEPSDQSSLPPVGRAGVGRGGISSLSRQASARLSRGFCAFAALLMAAFILAMQSRGALLGAAGGTLLILVGLPGRWRALAGLAAASACWLLLAPATLQNHAQRLMFERGTSHRLDIWARTLEQIHQKPFFGHGLAATVPPSPTGFPHSLYLSLLFYSGILGLLLFGGLAAIVTRRLVRRPMAVERVWVAALWLNTLLAGITDFGQITKGPGPLWVIVWVPVALALSLPPSGHAQQGRPLPRQPRRRGLAMRR